MFGIIKSSLEREGVKVWRITELHTLGAELYYIKKKLDLPRVKDMLEYRVEIFRDFEEDGKRLRGNTTALVSPGMEAAEVARRIRGAYFAGQFVKNPFYELPAAIVHDHVPSESDLAALAPEDAVRKMAEALFAADCDDEGFINSAELFANHRNVHILASNGLNVSFEEDWIEGELVTQCLTPRDVEQFRSFRFDSLDTAAMGQKVRDALRDVRLRAAAESAPAAGKYDLLLTGEHLSEILKYYAFRSNAMMIYPKYSSWQLGSPVQGEQIRGETLSLSLCATRPFSEEGVPMRTRPLIRDGKLALIHGDARFCRYLGVEPTGNYRKLLLHNGSRPLKELRAPGVLEAVCFSDFQMDPLSGHFGGEIRLALLHGAQGSVALTGGSVNCSLPEAQAELIFSNEQTRDASYEGPFAVLIRGVTVAGA